jgi:Acyl-CoA dehydrogenase, C-terminal domain
VTSLVTVHLGANLRATETLVRITSDAMRVWGATALQWGLTSSGHCATPGSFVIGDGSSQMKRSLIARQMGL